MMGEYIWYILAAVGAGIGTGLAGLSAATVMVPILIVLCPAFAGEQGPYQATAIALASDILGSAVASYTYAKNKNIDLKHGWIMLCCIVTMSTAGSVAAYFAGSRVLGGFTLFLTFFIGIRYLIKPDTSRKDTGAGEAKLGLKGVIISLFFGLTIGFGTGFVGSGGGMMMVVVFTAFLGYGLKAAVGTSTFIMTFTAIIAFTSHALIHPEIILENWKVLLLCMGCVTLSSLVSARFANRVPGKTAGLVTGVALTALGAVLLYLRYLEPLDLSAFWMDVLRILDELLEFLVIAVITALFIFRVLHVDGELRRKTLHFIAFMITPVTVGKAEYWYAVAFVALAFAALVYPILCLCENMRFYNRLFQQRKTGEIKNSLLLLFGMEAALVTVFWGLLDSKVTVMSAIIAWGLGDAAAALIGKRFGKRKILWRIADNKKSYAGSGAMLLVDFAVILTCLGLSGYGWDVCLLTALVTAAVASFTELVTKGGYDTVTVPAAAALSIWGMLQILG